MKVKFKKDCDYSKNGIEITKAKAGEVHDIEDGLAEKLCKSDKGWCEKHEDEKPKPKQQKARKKAPENKAFSHAPEDKSFDSKGE